VEYIYHVSHSTHQHDSADHSDAEASRAARILGLDYADAVTGFEFKGRHGTAVINGIVAAHEFKDAIEAVIIGFRDEQARAEEEMRTLAALRMWKKFMVGLRIRERVAGYEVEGEDMDIETVDSLGPGSDAIEEDMESEEYIDDGGGGFFPE
jgi:xeroderma pigmentosum group C-complementing protein